MKKYLLLSAAILFPTTALFAQQTVEGHYGKSKFDVAYSAAATTDGGYIITGLTQSGIDPAGDIVVIKSTAHGDTMWSRTFGGPNLEGGNFVMQTSDGGYMVSGHTQDFGAQDCDAFLLKLDQYGSSQWIKTYGGDSDDIGEGIVELPAGGGYVIAGMTASYGNTGVSMNRHVYLIKTNSTGDTTWTKVYAGAGVEECYSIARMNDGGFLAAGWSTSFGSGENDGWLLRLDANGDTLWTRLYQNIGDTRLNKIIHTADNGFLLAGYTVPATNGESQGMAIKLDANGNEVWKKMYATSGTNIGFHDVAQLPTGNFIFSGISYVTSGTANVYILTTDASGAHISDETCGGDNSYAMTIAVQGNNSYLVAGSATKYGDPLGDLYFMEVDNTVAHVGGVTIELPRMYPNPVSDKASIILPESEAYQSTHIDVMDILGNVVYTNANVMGKDVIISRNDLASGTYFYRVTCKDGKTFRAKFIVE